MYGVIDWAGRLILPPDVEFLPLEDIWWRATIDVWGRGMDTVFLEPFPVISVTPRGVWLDCDGRKKFVRGNGIKQWAVPTVELAVLDLMRRLEVRERHLLRELMAVRERRAALINTKEWRRWMRN